MTKLLLLRSWRPFGYLVVAAGVMALTLMTRGAPWRGEWAWTFDWLAGSSTLLGPLVAGMAAFETADGRPFDHGLARPTATRRWAVVLAPLAGPIAAVVGAYLAGAVAATAVSALRHPTDHADPVLVLLGAAVLAIWAGLGGVIGHLLPRGPAAVAAWLGGLVVTIASAAVSVPHLFRLGASTGSLAGLSLRWSALGSYASAYLLLGTAVALRLRGGPISGALRAVAVAAVVGLVLVSAWLAHDDRLYEPLAAARYRCSATASSPRVCLLAGNTTQLEPWRRGLAELVEVMERVGVHPVSEYRQPSPDGMPMPRGVGVVMFAPDQVNIAEPTLAQLAGTIARPSDCPQFLGTLPPVEALDAASWLAEYLAQTAQPAAAAQRDPRVLAWMTKMRPDRQVAWAAAAYERLRTCDFTGLDVPADA